MKTIAKTVLAALLLSTATFASTAAPTRPMVPAGPTTPTSSYKVAVYPSATAPAKLNVMVERAPGKSMGIYLRDAQGYILATQYVSKHEGNLHIKFDLSALEDGNYRVEVVSGNDKTVHSVELTTKVAQSARTIELI
ncbi:hypothetical protein [Spirosoma areae]